MAASDLVLLAAVKAWCGVTSAADDALLSTLISQISRAIYNYIGRGALLPATLTQTYDGNGRDSLILRDWPVGSISSLIVDGFLIPAASPMVVGQAPTGGYIVEAADDSPPGFMQTVIIRAGYVPGLYGPLLFCKGRQNVQVTYRAGYEILGEVATVPAGGGSVTAQQPYGNWGSDTGVTYANGTALTAVSGAPNVGQYQLSTTPGQYNFSAADGGAGVLLNYGYIPADLEQCALEWVAERYRYRDRIGQKSKSLGGQETVTYDNRAIPDFVATSLQSFKRIIAN